MHNENNKLKNIEHIICGIINLFKILQFKMS